MENLIDYLIYVLMGYNVRVIPSVSAITMKREWLLLFGEHEDVSIVLDEFDLSVIKVVANNRTLDDEERRRYEKLFELCV